MPIHKEMGKRIKVSDYPYCEVDEKIRIVHPANYSGEGGKIPTALCSKFEKNIISGHNHQVGIQTSLSGKYWGMDHGWSGDEKKIEYYKMQINTSRTWQNGFSMVKNGKPYLFPLKFTDWDYWLGK